MKTIDLNGAWKMKRLDSAEWINARVPGSVVSDLMNAGLMEDPYYRENETIALEKAEHDYLYEREFTVDKAFLDSGRIALRCLGIDTVADIAVNGAFAAHTENMHRTYEFDVKPMLREGMNSIQVKLCSPLQYIREKDALGNGTWGTPTASVKGFQHIRKAHCMFGWDWGPKIPNQGI